MSVPENKVGEVVVKMPVTDGDDPNTPAWATKFKIISGDSGGMFSITTGPNKQEGIITTAKVSEISLGHLLILFKLFFLSYHSILTECFLFVAVIPLASGL